MLLIECVVNEVLSQPYQKNGFWWVDINYHSMTNVKSPEKNKTSLNFDSYEDAISVKIGTSFYA